MRNKIKKKTAIGIGLIALDLILNGSLDNPPKYHAGGSCGNVLTILSYFNWKSFPVARLGVGVETKELINDFVKFNVKTDLISVTDDGSTPVIIHRIKLDKEGVPTHRFEFKDPLTGKWLPKYKPVLRSKVKEVIYKKRKSEFFYFDRISRAAIDLAQYYRKKGSVIFFEPTGIKDINLFKECLKVSDIVKFSKERISSYKKLFPKPQTFLEIQTNGSFGLEFRSKNVSIGNSWTKQNAIRIKGLVDAAGAGDWCSAGIIDSLCLNGSDGLLKNGRNKVERALKYGQVLGAMNCLYSGARGLMYEIDSSHLIKIVNLVFEKRINVIDSSIKIIH